MSVNRKAKLQIRLQCPQRKHESTILCQAVYNIITQEISISLLNLFVCIKRWGIVTLTFNMNTWRVSHFSFSITGILWRIARYHSKYKKYQINATKYGFICLSNIIVTTTYKTFLFVLSCLDDLYYCCKIYFRDVTFCLVTIFLWFDWSLTSVAF